MKKKETRFFVGKVVSVSMAKTVIVEVVRTHAHKLYKKIIRRSRRFAAHNMLEGIAVGDTVRIAETKPISKTKHCIVVERL